MKTISKLFLLFSIILLSSCDETELDQTVTNQVNPQKEEDSRIAFNSAKEFYNTLDTLSYLTYEEQTEWIRASGIKYPLYKDLEFCEDEIMTEMPRAFQALFNHKMEMQINDTVIAFEKGNMYVKSIKEKILPVPVLYGQVGVNQEESEVTTRTVYETKYGKIGTSYQYEFKIPEGKSKYKYVHELKSVIINVCKRNLAKVKYNQEIRIDVQNMDSKSHSINIEGYIIHEVVGIPSTKMFNGWSYPLVEWQPR